jgi:hypothetical protein
LSISTTLSAAAAGTDASAVHITTVESAAINLII